MQFLHLYIRHRLLIGFVFLALAIWVNYTSSFWPAFILYLVAVISIVGHFIIGPLRLVQERLMAGDIDGTKKILDGIKFPGLLLKPIRSNYYAVKSQLAMANKDYDAAEDLMRKSVAASQDSSLVKGNEGAQKLQLGMLAMQKGNVKEGENLIRAAIRAGLPDKDSEAAAFLQMSNIMINKRQFRAGKDFFKKAKDAKSKAQEIVDQIKQMEKYISRLPG